MRSRDGWDSDSDASTVIHDLIVEGEALQSGSSDAPREDTFIAWVHRVRAILASTFGTAHRFAIEVQEAAHLAEATLDETPPAMRYLRVRTLVVLKVLRRAAFDLHVRIGARRSRERPANSATAA